LEKLAKVGKVFYLIVQTVQVYYMEFDLSCA